MDQKSYLNKRNGVIAAIVLAAVQYLVPAFTHITEAQKSAVSMFAIVCSVALTGKAFDKNPDGTDAKTPYQGK